jgi:hypothetical protein
MITSSINFETASSSADLKDATDVLQQWLESHESLSYFTFDQLRVDLSEKVSLEKLNRVLLRLTSAGELRVAYRVKFREGEYSEEEFDTIDDIPACVFDSAFTPRMVSEKDRIPVYRPVR